MVESAQKRINKQVVKIQPHMLYLRIKALLRWQVYNVPMTETVKALKDAAAKEIIDGYNFDIRDKLNAWQAWRELYYTFYKTNQKVEKIVS